jgi:iron complex outermembrane receptor protein
MDMNKAVCRALLASASLMASSAAFAQAAPVTPSGSDAAASNPAETTSSQPVGGPAAASTDAAISGQDQPANSADIVVTAQRRAQSVLSVPLSISAVKGETLVATGVTGITALRFNTPGFASATGSGYTQIFIRGIGNQIYVGADPSVATFIDDTPRVYGTLVDDLLNVDRVEVLKGAQGGLYGRNATGGVVNVITRQPVNKFIAEGRISYGTKKSFEASAFINLPLNDNVAFNFTAVRKSHDEYTPNRSIKNPYASYAALSPAAAAAYGDTGQRAYLAANPGIVTLLDSGTKKSKLQSQDLWAFDMKLGFRGDGFKVVLQADYNNKHDADGVGWTETPQSRTSAYGVYSFLLGADPASGGFGLPNAVLPFNYFYPLNRKKSKYDTFASYGADASVKDYGGSVKADIDMPGFTLTSITAFRWNANFFRGDVGAANVPVSGFDTPVHRRNFYQEIRMVSTGNGPFRWLAGATYFHDRNREDSLLATLGIPNPFAQVSFIKTNAFSGYAQGEYNITDALKVIGSIRYITEVKTGSFPAQTVLLPTNAGVQFVPVDAATTTTGGVHRFLPALTLSYGLPSGGNIYARWARGVKTGGVNPVVHPAQLPNNQPNVFKPESVDTYEIGVRTNLADRKVQVTAAVFYNKYKDLQVTRGGTPGVIQLVYFNAGKARTYGAEASVAWQPNKIFNFSANLGYLNAKYINFSSPGLPTLGVGAFDVSGNAMPFSSKWQGSVTASLDAPVTDSFNAVASILYSYQSKYTTELTADPRVSQKGFSLVNLRAGVKTSDGRLGGYISVRNLFNKLYKVYGTTFGGAGAVYIPGHPRIVQGTVEVKF